MMRMRGCEGGSREQSEFFLISLPLLKAANPTLGCAATPHVPLYLSPHPTRSP